MDRKILNNRVLFGGYYGMDNVGDDCFGVISAWGAKRYWGTGETLLLSRKPLAGEIATNSCLTGKKYFKGQATLVSFWQMLRSSCVVWSGGSIFHSRGQWYTPMDFSFLAAAAGMTPVGAIGVSLGPYRSVRDQKYVHRQLRRLSFLALRDRVSFDEARTLNLSCQPVLASDLAMLLPRIVPAAGGNDSNSSILGVTICHYERYTDRDTRNEIRREATLLHALLELVARGFSGILRLFIFNANSSNGDRAITKEFYAKLQAAGARLELVDYSNDPVAVFSRVAECRAMISTRLHGAIFSAAANVPCCLIEYHRKCTDFIAEAGVAEEWRIGDADCAAAELAAKLQDLLTTPAAGFYPRRDELIAMAERNFTFPEQ